MDPGQLKQKEKVRETKEFTIGFKVNKRKEFTMGLKVNKRKPVLEVIKPDLPKKARSDLAGTSNITYPKVRLKTERAENRHAFFIMHNLHHKNILSLKVLAKSKSQSDNPSSVAAFVEQFSESLEKSLKNLNLCVDGIKHFPSPDFQKSVRDIITGLDFLWKNGLYHGNLNWSNTLLKDGTVKLAGFEMKDMDFRDAQFEDLQSLIRMLEEVSNHAAAANKSLAEKDTEFCGTLDSLIDMLRVDQALLPNLKETVLEHPFFWNSAKRISFFACTVSLKLSDDNFIERVRNSNLCGKSWDKKRKGSCTEFQDLVTKMNDYRTQQYDGDSIEDFVKLICGAYTHCGQFEFNVDQIIQACYPMICIDMKRLVEA